MKCYNSYYASQYYSTKYPTMNCVGTLSLDMGDKVSVHLNGDFHEIEDTKITSFEGSLYQRL